MLVVVSPGSCQGTPRGVAIPDQSALAAEEQRVPNCRLQPLATCFRIDHRDSATPLPKGVHCSSIGLGALLVRDLGILMFSVVYSRRGSSDRGTGDPGSFGERCVW